MKDLHSLKLYARVARLGSFSAAAREFNLAQSQVSRLVAELEAGLGARLLARTTRAVTPTEAGLRFLAQIEPILAALEDAENSVRETGELRGLMRVGVPATLAISVVIPNLPAFAELHPQLRIEVMLDDRNQDMVKEAVDVGIRVGRLPDATGTTKLIGKMRRIAVASPIYLARNGTPTEPVDVEKHRIVAGPAAMQQSSWQFQRDGQMVQLVVQPNFVTNDTAGAVAAAASGLGITSSTSWACRRDLESGALVKLLPDWEMAELPVHAYFPLGRATRLAPRAFVDFIAERIQAMRLDQMSSDVDA